MQLLVFAHVPPPHHGQSYMVKLMLDGFAEAPAIECLHVDARYSSDLSDVGGFRLEKVARLFVHCARALALQRQTGVRTLYYVPAPPRRVPVLRDVATLLLLKPFFPRLVLHWHAAGLGEWLEAQPSWLRLPVSAVFRDADLSIALAGLSAPDASKLRPKRCEVVHYGIPDPQPDFAVRLLPQRRSRARAIAAAFSPSSQASERIRVLFIGMCTREKGLFDVVNGVRIANARLAARGNPTRFELHVAGEFTTQPERAELEALVSTPDWAGLWHYHGFVAGSQKRALFEASDVMAFATYYPAESFPVVVLEAMAAGLPVIATRWRAIPEMLPSDYPGFVAVRDPAAIAGKLEEVCVGELGVQLRERYLSRFTVEQYLKNLAAVILAV